MTNITAVRNCEHCKRKMQVRLVRNITTSGSSQVYWYCTFGKHPIARNGSSWIKHEIIREAGFDPDDLPVIENYSGTELCAVCGSPFAERHHFAPRHLFGDEAEQWPTAYLCKKHHDRWHALVTPNMDKTTGTWTPTKSPSRISN